MTRYLLAIAAFVLSISIAQAQMTKSVNVEASTITWTGKKVTGAHTGTIDVKEANLQFTDDKLSGGSIVIDMTSLTNTDLSGGGKGKLEGHLKSDDFFGVTNHPTATLMIKDVQSTGAIYNITGDLTIKGTTAPISFNAEMVDGKAVAKITVDRTKYNVRYGSGKFFENLGDKTIYDNFDLEVSLAL